MTGDPAPPSASSPSGPLPSPGPPSASSPSPGPPSPSPGPPSSSRPTAATPGIDDFTRPYWDAAAEGELLIRRCGACGRPHHYPREFCPHCWSEDVVWERACGRATLYTWSVVHRNDLPPCRDRVPYTAALVELAEGPRMMTEVVDCPPGRLAVGMDLEAAFRTGEDGVTVPVFRPLARVHGQSSSRSQPPPAERR